MAVQAENTATPRSFDDIVVTLRDIGERVIAEHADEADRDARFPTEAFDALKKAQMLSSYVPTSLGGDGL